jgi:uncharacterized protein (TIGR02687 family)
VKDRQIQDVIRESTRSGGDQMKAEQIDQSLRVKFLGEGHRLVFWNDPSGEFAEYVESGLPDDLDQVQILNLNQGSGLATKLLLEREAPETKFLLYRSGPVLPAEQDWLLDIRLYSAEFHADMASLWLQELGIAELRLRGYLESRSDFLRSQKRRSKLRDLLDPGDDEEAMDHKMLAVLAGTEVAHLFAILRSLCELPVARNHFDLARAADLLVPIKKMGLAECFWRLVEQTFGYHQEEPSLGGLLRHLFVSELLCQSGEGEVPSLSQFQLQEVGTRNARGCLTQWRDSAKLAPSYDAAAAAVARELKLAEPLREFSLDSLTPVFTFLEAERQIAAKLMQVVLDEDPAWPLEAVREVASRRKSGYWLSGPGKDQTERKTLSDAYDAIVAAAELFALSREHQGEFSYPDAEALLLAYQTDLHRFDRFYRLFHTQASGAQRQGWDLLKPLTQRVEEVYDQAFLVPMGLEWSRLLDGGFLDRWRSEALPPQQKFYQLAIAPHLEKSERHRAYVIVSDALRYEAAVDLVADLNGRYRIDAKIKPMLGVLPSYTALGMAALLPHKTLSYTDKGDVLVDGCSVANTEARGKQLAKFGGMACKAKELREMKLQEAREFVRGRRLVYIYHDVIDALGDKEVTEEKTFAAVKQCIEELVGMVRFCINKLNAGTVWVTADHGFLFQQTRLDETDKSVLSVKPEETFHAKKRFVLKRILGPCPEAHLGSTEVAASTEDRVEFWLPRGANRFHFKGGARFVHGGAMPQEVVVPLVTVTELRGKKKEASRSEKVGVSVLGSNFKITTARHRFEFIQTEPVGDRRSPLSVRVAIYDQSNQPVSSVETLTFDSDSERLEERKKEILLDLVSGEFDKSKAYRLVLRDAETEVEVFAVPVKIDRSFDEFF